MIPYLPSSLLDQPGLVARVDFFLPMGLVLWTPSPDTVRELIRSAARLELVVGDETGQNLFVRKTGTEAWMRIQLKEVDSE